MFLVLIAHTNAGDPAAGVMEGHLKIISLKEVELATDGTPEKAETASYAEYPLVIRAKDGSKEIARITADPNGNFRAELPAGDYVLDIPKRERKHARVIPRAFTVLPNQTVHVDMDVDTGVR
jgi:hypothetical protein